MTQSETHSAWYQDNYETPRVGKKRRGWLIAIIAAAVLALLVASALFFSRHDFHFSLLPDRDVWTFDFTLPLPGTGDGPSFRGGGDEDGKGGTIGDLFNSIERSTPLPASRIDRVGTNGDVTLPLSSSTDLPVLELQEIYEKCAPSVVGIETRENGSIGYYWSSGVIFTSDGYILTNQHVVSDTDRASVILANGARFDAKLVGEDNLTDLAVLKIDAVDLPVAEFGDSSELAVGDPVVAIGNPLGAELSGTMTDGIVSAINRNISMNGRNMTLIQTNAAINEGNSGGPLINRHGQVIGITNMKMGSAYSEVAVEGLGFAIPSTTCKSVADQLLSTGEVAGRPGLGITVGQISAEMAEQYGVPEGLYISDIAEDSDAARQDVKVGDVLLKVDGQEVRTADDVLAIRDRHAVGDVLTLTLWRDGSTFDVDIRLFDQNRIY